MKKEKLKKIGHLISAFVILIHSYERFETGHSSYILFLIFGLIFALLAIFHHRISALFPKSDNLFFIIEGVLSLVISYEYFSVGKKMLPLVYLLVGIFQIFFLPIIIKKRANYKTDLD